MSMLFVANPHPNAEYQIAFKDLIIVYVTQGDAIDLEQITSVLINSTKEDFLCLDGLPAICAACLVIWLKLHGECAAYHLVKGKWTPRFFFTRAIEHHIERQRDISVKGADHGR